MGLSESINNVKGGNSRIIEVLDRNIDWIYIIKSLVIAFIILIFVLLLVAYAILAERKVLGSIQKEEVQI